MAAPVVASIGLDAGIDRTAQRLGEVPAIIEELIAAESKKKPLSDDKIAELLQAKGYNIARRTVAKYRDVLNIPVARLRKEI